MLNQTCACGARYRFDESSIGKRAKCKRCGVVFTLQGDEAPLTLASEPILRIEDQVVARQNRLDDATLPGHESLNRNVESGSQPVVDSSSSSRNYRESTLRALLFPSSPHNLVTFIILWVFLGAAQYGSQIVSFIFALGAIVRIVVYGWYAAYQFQIIGNAAGGEEDLPRIEISADSLFEYFVSASKWLGSWVIVFAPAMIYFVVSDAPIDGTFALASAGPSAWMQATGAELIFLLLLGMGVSAWPMVILCIALGGFSSFLRPDLLLKTFVRSRVGYFLTLAMLAGAISLQASVRDALVSLGTGSFLNSMLFVGIKLYTDIIVMKFIGLYYHHFKHKFAWSWG